MGKVLKSGFSKLVLEELEHRAESLEEDEPIDAGYIRSGLEKIKQGEKLSDNEHQAISLELKDMSDWDVYREHWQEFYCAEAWLGTLTKYDPHAVYSGRKPKKVIIDGVTYERWH